MKDKRKSCIPKHALSMQISLFLTLRSRLCCVTDANGTIFTHIAPVGLVDLRHVARIVRRNDRT